MIHERIALEQQKLINLDKFRRNVDLLLREKIAIENRLSVVVNAIRQHIATFEEGDAECEKKISDCEIKIKEFKKEMQANEEFFHAHMDAPLTHERSFHVHTKGQQENTQINVNMVQISDSGSGTGVDVLEEKLMKVIKNKK